MGRYKGRISWRIKNINKTCDVRGHERQGGKLSQGKESSCDGNTVESVHQREEYVPWGVQAGVSMA